MILRAQKDPGRQRTVESGAPVGASRDGQRTGLSPRRKGVAAVTLAVLMLSVGAASAGITCTAPTCPEGYSTPSHDRGPGRPDLITVSPAPYREILRVDNHGLVTAICDLPELLAASREWAHQSGPGILVWMKSLVQLSNDDDPAFYVYGRKAMEMDARWRKAVEACGK